MLKEVEITPQKIILDKVLVVKDVMEVGVVSKEVMNKVLVEDTKHRALQICHRVFIGGIF